MERIRRLFQRRPSYEPLSDSADAAARAQQAGLRIGKRRFSRVEYAVFLLLGIAMLWAWNMFLAAAPYFQSRFKRSKPLLSNFQATEISVSTVANLGSMLILAKLQSGANYPRRIVTSLLINLCSFSLLAASTKQFLSVSEGVYFAFFVLMVFSSSLATGFMQNGTFAYVAGFGRGEYMQAIMAGQAIAGVLPPVVQIASVLSASKIGASPGQGSSTSALAYFLTAVGVVALTLVVFSGLVKHQRDKQQRAPLFASDTAQDDDPDRNNMEYESEAVAGTAALAAGETPTSSDGRKKAVPLLRLFRKLFFSALAVFFNFGITMVFPVFTQQILSVDPSRGALFHKDSFIPLAFLVWNVGDLLGRLIPLIPRLFIGRQPKLLLALALARVVFVFLYLTCNIQPAQTSEGSEVMIIGPTVRSDTFYLLIVQFPFGLSNGYLGSCCMMGSGELVEEDEKEAAGGFMGLMLVAGLATGSICSFFIGNPT